MSLQSYRYKAFFFTILAATSFAGLLGMFAALKFYISSELGFESGFLGVLETASFIGRIAGSFYILFFPPLLPKKAFLIQSFLTTLFMTIIPLIGFFHEHLMSVAQPLLVISMLVSGFSRAYILIPFLVVSEYFDPNTDKMLLNIWYSFIMWGDIFALFSCYIGVHRLFLSWEVCFSIGLALFLTSSLLFYIFLEEISSEEPEGYIERAKNTCLIFKSFFSSSSHLLWVLDNCMQETLVYNITIWLPYYLTSLDFKLLMPIVASLYQIMIFLGTLTFEFMVQTFELERYSSKMIAVLNMLSLTFLIALVFVKDNQFLLYMVFIVLLGFVQGGPLNRICCLQLLTVAGQDKNLKTFLVFFARMALNISIVILMVIIGYAMEQNLKSFVYFLAGNACIFSLIYITRNFICQLSDHEPLVVQNKVI